MNEPITFYFDSLCPWCWQTSCWIRQIETASEVDVTWGLFSLAIVNWEKPLEEFDPDKGAGVKSLRTAIKARDIGGNSGIGAYYKAIGHRVFDLVESVNEINTLKAAAVDAGFTTSLVTNALEDPTTWDRLKSEHMILCAETRSFGVPTIRLGSGHTNSGTAADASNGLALFGPVISKPAATTQEAVELWHHVRWLAAYENFAELKRDRLPLDLESYKSRQPQSS